MDQVQLLTHLPTHGNKGRAVVGIPREEVMGGREPHLRGKLYRDEFCLLPHLRGLFLCDCLEMGNVVGIQVLENDEPSVRLLLGNALDKHAVSPREQYITALYSS